MEYSGGRYRVDVELIVYLARNRSTFDIWEMDIYCAVDGCSNPMIFQEIPQQLSANVTNLNAFPLVRPTTTTTTTTTEMRQPLTCYTCDCANTARCACSDTEIISAIDGFCVVIRFLFGQTIFNYMDTYEYESLSVYISEFPNVIVEESINYDEQGGFWFTTTNLVLYSCNWNLCNKPDLIPLLPNSFHMRLPESWLNSSVLGSGLPVRDCHECPDEEYCGTTDYLDSNVCPIQACNTTCLVIDSYDDPAYDYLCYHSYCLPPDTQTDPRERHRIEIEGIIYANDPTNIELFEIDIYCRADNCSNPVIFRELHEQLTVQIGDLAGLFNETYDPTIPQRRCYDCFCSNFNNCTCAKIKPLPANETHCIISREIYGQTAWGYVGHLSEDSSKVHIRDFPYIVVQESILYSEQTGLWNTVTNYVLYGCNWDLCNDLNLEKYLPNSFQMRLNETWLNSSVLGSGLPVRNCHECPYGPVCSVNSSIDGDQCPIMECNTTCLVYDTYDDPSHGMQCYQSFCLPPDTEFYQPERHRIEIEGILYLHKQPRSVELWEVDIFCRADDCSRPGIFDEVCCLLQNENHYN